MYQIRNKQTGELWKARSGKALFDKMGSAKSAWFQTYKPSWINEQPEHFDDNTEYELVEYIDENVTRLTKAELLLSKCIGRCEYDLQKEIEEFLK